MTNFAKDFAVELLDGSSRVDQTTALRKPAILPVLGLPWDTVRLSA